MKRKYKHIFFDLDHTLWDFERNSSEVLLQLYDDHQLKDLGGFSKEDFCAKFRVINHELWSSFNKKKLTRDSLRSNRFNLVLEALGSGNGNMGQMLAEDYMLRCPTMPYIFPFAQEVLHYLKNEKKYALHIITNGFEDVQHVKLTSSRLSHYFQEVITADSAGYQKPDKEIFDYALTKTCCLNEECLMIGDNLEVDIIGAKNARIDQVFFNPLKMSHKETITFEISCLSELLKIL